jgi:hypothetical protein
MLEAAVAQRRSTCRLVIVVVLAALVGTCAGALNITQWGELRTYWDDAFMFVLRWLIIVVIGSFLALLAGMLVDSILTACGVYQVCATDRRWAERERYWGDSLNGR